jgi:putative colanic acid biosynthesis acetyltransferase WcaF
MTSFIGSELSTVSPTIYRNQLGLANQFKRLAWSIARSLLYRPTPNFMHAWRRSLLRAFGGRISAGAHPYPRCRIWAPWNLTMGEHSCLANDVDCYCVAPIELGAHALVSQDACLCTATHDYESAEFTLVTSPIFISSRAWVAAGAFVGPGVTVGEGAVCGARSVVTRDVEPWTVAAGNPAKTLKRRRIRGAGELNND